MLLVTASASEIKPGASWETCVLFTTPSYWWKSPIILTSKARFRLLDIQLTWRRNGELLPMTANIHRTQRMSESRGHSPAWRQANPKIKSSLTTWSAVQHVDLKEHNKEWNALLKLAKEKRLHEGDILISQATNIGSDKQVGQSHMQGLSTPWLPNS